MYDCDQCDYKDKRKGKLKMHKESIHKKITYSCDQCEYKTKRKEYLPRHIKSIHGEARCACDQCEYKAKRKGFLEKHIESIHVFCAQQKSAGLLKNEFDKTQKFCPNNIVSKIGWNL